MYTQWVLRWDGGDLPPPPIFTGALQIHMVNFCDLLVITVFAGNYVFVNKNCIFISYVIATRIIQQSQHWR